jgi:hypothetical protein
MARSCAERTALPRYIWGINRKARKAFEYSRSTGYYNQTYLQNTGLGQLLVTAIVVPNSPILVALMKEALSSSEMSVLTRATGVTSQKTPFFIVTAVKTPNLTCLNVARLCADGKVCGPGQ